MDSTQQVLRAGRGPHSSPRPLSPSQQLAVKIENAVRRATGDRVSELRVDVDDDCVALRGRCGTFYTAQLAQHAAMSMAGVREVANKISVA